MTTPLEILTRLRAREAEMRRNNHNLVEADETREVLELIDSMQAALKESQWRVEDIRSMLLEPHYVLDEWSTPIKNLSTLKTIVDAAQAN